MANKGTQTNHGLRLAEGLGASIKHVVSPLIGARHVWAELTSAAAHYDGLIDSIDRAGWDIAQLEKVGHAFDASAQDLIKDLTESYPDMSAAEQRSFLAPFYEALHQFCQMNQAERLAFRNEYSRFTELHARSLQEFASDQPIA